MVTQFNSNELKKYLVESSPYLIIERKNYPINSIIKKQKIILDNLSHHEVLFKIGEFEKVDIVFVPNEKNDILEIECYNEQYENDDTIKIIKNKERINISPGGDSLVPGKYLIKLKRKQKIYELLYEIISSNTKTDNTTIMREYIDRHFENLSKNKNSKVLVTDKKCLVPIILNIINNPITNISKDRFNKKIITTDNIENKNLKTILIALKNSNEYKDNYFDFFLEKTWLKDIKASKIIKPTIRFIKDINYGKIYEEYNISSKDKKLPYKKNSSLFEIYSFLIISEKEEHRIYEDIMFLPIDFKNPIEDILIEIKYLLNEIDTINDLFVASTV